MLLGKQILAHRASRFKKGISRICYRVEDPRLLYLSEQLRLERSSRLTHDGSMYIGNIHWKHCSLETSFAFGNKKCILETYIGYWKQKKDIGNMQKRLETYSGYWKHHFSLETHIY